MEPTAKSCCEELACQVLRLAPGLQQALNLWQLHIYAAEMILMLSICLCQNLLSNRDPNWTQSCSFLMSGVSGCPRCHATQKDRWETRDSLPDVTTGGIQQTSVVTLFLRHLERMTCIFPNSSMLLIKSVCPAYCSLFLECPAAPLPYLVSCGSKYQYNGAVKSYKVVCCLLGVRPWANQLTSPSFDSLSMIQEQ